MQIIPAVLIATLSVLISCKNSNQYTWSELPEVTNINRLQHTEFVPTLESPVEHNKNIIYAPAFLYAWDKVKQKLNTPISLTNNNSAEFKLLNQSVSYKNTLLADEYSAEAELAGNVIFAKAFFNKTLPFPSGLQKLDDPILFDNTKVSVFGMQSYNEETVKFTEILYYKDDDNFILKFTPKDTLHEIQLVKGITSVMNLSDALRETRRLIDLGEKEKSASVISWKYTLNDIDIFSVPVIKFNIEKNYSSIEGQVFTTKNKKHSVEIAYQRTGFILNEKGAVVESEANVVVDSAVAELIKVQPKKMIFDKPFFVIIKRAKSENPYFVMWVRNSELLTKK
ncbi:MAG: hypothetical protein SFU87_07990 [Chitinophagaceae bacterium]|nr:hypothetical protein [Chitinophagaceae bacterium]